MYDLQNIKPNGILQVFKDAWDPRPLRSPVLDKEVYSFNVFTRTTESIKHFILKVEYFISPGGWLRSWFKLNLFLCVALGIPTIFIMPVLTALMAGIASITFYIYQAMYNTLMALVCLIGIIVCLTILFSIFACFAAKKRS